jgi:hypothetical protein
MARPFKYNLNPIDMSAPNLKKELDRYHGDWEDLTVIHKWDEIYNKEQLKAAWIVSAGDAAKEIIRGLAWEPHEDSNDISVIKKKLLESQQVNLDLCSSGTRSNQNIGHRW